MTIQDAASRKLRMQIAMAPVALPHYCDDLKTQRRVGKVISAEKQPPDFRISTIWL
jgi:hypothetical protein